MNTIADSGEQIDFWGNRIKVDTMGKGEIRQASLTDWAKLNELREEAHD